MKPLALSRARRAIAHAKEYVVLIRNLSRIPMWTYPKDKLSPGYSLQDLWDRTMAAQSCGHEVVLKATDAGIEVSYVKNVRLIQPPDI